MDSGKQDRARRPQGTKTTAARLAQRLTLGKASEHTRQTGSTVLLQKYGFEGFAGEVFEGFESEGFTGWEGVDLVDDGCHASCTVWN